MCMVETWIIRSGSLLWAQSVGDALPDQPALPAWLCPAPWSPPGS